MFQPRQPGGRRVHRAKLVGVRARAVEASAGGGAGAVRLLVVSDTHLSDRAPEAGANWEAVARYVGSTRPRLVIHVGDLTLDGANHPSELARARRLLDRLDAPCVVVPGNHDIGDSPVPGAAAESTVDERRLARWTGEVGEDRWSLDLGGWLLVGINAQVFGSGLAAEAAQWSWLSDTLDDTLSTRPVVVVMHKPMSAGVSELRSAPPYRFVSDPARQRLTDLMKSHSVMAVVSGHVHQYRVLGDQHRRHVWAPTTWAVLPDHDQPVLGMKRCGVVQLTLTGDTQVLPSLVEPVGLRQLTLTTDIADPYDAP